MRHGIAGRKFSRTSSHRSALLKNLVKSLVQHGQIRTTLPKAKDLRSVVERLVTLGKKQTLHARRVLIARVGDVSLVEKLFSEISSKFMDRPGGYTRIIKAGFRPGDDAPMAFIQFVDYDPSHKIDLNSSTD